MKHLKPKSKHFNINVDLEEDEEEEENRLSSLRYGRNECKNLIRL